MRAPTRSSTPEDLFRFPPSAEEALIDAVRVPGEKLDSAGQPTRTRN